MLRAATPHPGGLEGTAELVGPFSSPHVSLQGRERDPPLEVTAGHEARAGSEPLSSPYACPRFLASFRQPPDSRKVRERELQSPDAEPSAAPRWRGPGGAAPCLRATAAPCWRGPGSGSGAGAGAAFATAVVAAAEELAAEPVAEPAAELLLELTATAGADDRGAQFTRSVRELLEVKEDLEKQTKKALCALREQHGDELSGQWWVEQAAGGSNYYCALLEAGAHKGPRPAR